MAAGLPIQHLVTEIDDVAFIAGHVLEGFVARRNWDFELQRDRKSISSVWPQNLDIQKEISKQRSADNIKRLAALLPATKAELEEEIGSSIVNALVDRDVEDPRIPDDNHQGTIISVGETTELELDFEHVEFYDEDVIGLRFELLTECTLNYAIFKADYYTLDEDKTDRISISERNDHYYDADEDYTVRAAGVLTMKLDGDKLREEELDDDALKEILTDADFDIDVEEVEVE